MCQAGNIKQGHEVVTHARFTGHQVSRVGNGGIELGRRLDGIIGQLDHFAHFTDDQSQRQVIGFQHHDMIAGAVAPCRMIETQMEVGDGDDLSAQAE